MIFVVLYKQLNFAADNIIDTGHAASTDCLLMNIEKCY